MPSCSVCSEAETEPQGYSAPIPIPIKKLCIAVGDDAVIRNQPTYRQAQSIAIIPPKLPFAPEEAADKPAKTATIPVAVI